MPVCDLAWGHVALVTLLMPVLLAVPPVWALILLTALQQALAQRVQALAQRVQALAQRVRHIQGPE